MENLLKFLLEIAFVNKVAYATCVAEAGSLHISYLNKNLF